MTSVAAASTLASQMSRGSAFLVFIRTAHSIYVPTAKARLSSEGAHLHEIYVVVPCRSPSSTARCGPPKLGEYHGSIICRDPAREGEIGHGEGIRQAGRSRCAAGHETNGR